MSEEQVMATIIDRMADEQPERDKLVKLITYNPTANMVIKLLLSGADPVKVIGNILPILVEAQDENFSLSLKNATLKLKIESAISS